MAITAKDVERTITASLKYMPDHLTAQEIANEAGELMVNMRAWNWLKAATTTLTLTADQAYVDLPSDFARIIYLEMSSSRTQSIYPATYREIVELRTAAIGQPQDYVYTVAANQGVGAPTYRLELFPTPASTAANALTLAYSAGWTEISTDTTALSMPVWIEGLYKQIVRAIVRGLSREDNAEAAGDFSGMERRLELIEQGPQMRYAKRRDTELMPNRGTLRNGIASMDGHAGRASWFWDRSVTGPTP
jgi:hypothetical protein